MRRKSALAVILMIVLIVALTGCNYVSRPIGAGNNASDNSSLLAELLKQPTKTIITENTVVLTEPEEEEPPAEEPPAEEPPAEEPPAEEPTPVEITSPFQTTSDVFEKIEALLQQTADNIVDATSATGVSDELMKGRTVYVYTPYDISGQDEAMMQSVANNLNMTVVVNNLNKTGAAYSAQMRKIALSGTKADLMFVDQNTWGDIQYYTQSINSYVNFELGEELGTFYRAMSQNYSLSDSYFDSEKSVEKIYVAAGIGAPYLLAYNKDNLVTTGTLAAETDEVALATYKEVALADPVEMYNNGTWGIKAMQQMLIDSTVSKCVGLATLKDTTSAVNWWFGCDNVTGFKLNIYSQAALLSSATDYFSVAGYSTGTLNTIQDLYWTNTGANGLNVASFYEAADQEKVLTKLFNNYSGNDAVTNYAMVGVEAAELADVFTAAGDAEWDFVGYPYGKIAEDIIRSTEPDENGNYLYNADMDVLSTYSAGWASGFAVLEQCTTPGIALRFAEDYTKAWQENYESSFAELLSEEQAERYKDMKKNMGVTFYTSMISHTAEMVAAYPGASGKTTNAAFSASTEFAATPELFTQPIFNKNVAIGSYDPETHEKWSDFVTTAKADGMAGAYILASIMFNY